MSKRRKEYELMHDCYVVVDTIADRDAISAENIHEMLRVGVIDQQEIYTRINDQWVIKDSLTFSITAGNGMDFPTITSSGNIVLGTPSTLTLGTTNNVTATSHTHNISIAQFSGSDAGLVPDSLGGTDKFLRADGTWQSNIPVEIYDYTFSTTTVESDPGAGKLRFNNSTYANVTKVLVSDTMYNGIDVSGLLDELKTDDTVYLQSLESVNGAVYFDVTGDSVARTGYYEIPVAYKDDAGTAVANDANCMFTIGTKIPTASSNNFLTSVTVNSINDVDFAISGLSDITGIDFGHNFVVHDDVIITSLANNHILKYDTATSKWINTPIPVIGAPLAHAASHMSGGSDEILLDELGTPTDVTTLNASTTHHGLLLKLSGVATEYLTGIGTWSSITDNYLTSVNTSNLASVTFNRISGSFTSDFSHTLTNHNDVTAASLSDGDILKYESASSQWVNVAIPQEHDLTTVLDTSTINFGISGQQITGSVIYQMSVTADASGLKFSGDLASPGNSKLYGTNSSGVKGWYDIPTAGTPTAHASTHENGGADEISVAGLSGLLADSQTPLTHASTHISTGSDSIPIFTTTASGLVPATTTSNTTDYLRRDGTWAAPAGSGSVTSVSAGNGMVFTTITTYGAVTMGTPSTITGSTTNSLTSTSHTHAITGFSKLGTGGANYVAVFSDASTISGSASFTYSSNVMSLVDAAYSLSLTVGETSIINASNILKVDANQINFNNILSDSGTYLFIKDSNATPYTNIVNITDALNESVFTITNTGKIYSPKILESSTAKSLYYNPTTGEISWFDAPSGGSSVWVSDANGIHYTAGKVGIGGDSSSIASLKAVASTASQYVQEIQQLSNTGHGLRISMSGSVIDLSTIISLRRNLGTEIFRFDIDSGFYIPELPNVTKDNFLYYDINNGQITYGLPTFYTKTESDARYLRIDGSNQMTGNLNLGLNEINNVYKLNAIGPTDAPILNIYASSTTQGMPADLPAQTTAVLRRNLTSDYTNYLSLIAGTSRFNSILFGDSTTSKRAEMRVNNADGTIEFYINGVKKVVIDSSGNVYAAGMVTATDHKNDPSPLP